MNRFRSVFYGERIKLRRNPIWLVLLVLPAVSAFMGTFNFLNNLSILSFTWENLWIQESLFFCFFFMPAVYAVYCSFSIRMENVGTNWNLMLSSPISLFHIYFSKLLMMTLVVLSTHLWIAILFVISGKLAGLPALPPWSILFRIVMGICGGVVICALQLVISLNIRNFAVPVGIAMIGGFSGVMMTLKGWQLFFPYSLAAAVMNTNVQGADFFSGNGLVAYLISCFFFLGLFILLGVGTLQRKLS